MTAYKVGYLIGSLAKGSINRKLAKALVQLCARPSSRWPKSPFRDLPLYSYDYDADFPPARKAFKEAIAAVEAVLFVTPEYNRSIPGGLKNAIDWASRPYGTELVHPQAIGGDRDLAGCDRHGGGPAEACAACSVSAIRRR